MTTLIPFKPDGRGPFQFTARIGEYETFARVPFNLYANRYYLELKDSSGAVSYTPRMPLTLLRLRTLVCPLTFKRKTLKTTTIV
ncbi:hypothetical protein ACI1VO_28415, partial [Escherichia coli]